MQNTELPQLSTTHHLARKILSTPRINNALGGAQLYELSTWNSKTPGIMTLLVLQPMSLLVLQPMSLLVLQSATAAEIESSIDPPPQ